MSNFADKPLAIVGLGVRLPGADNLEEFWRLLMEKRTGLGPLPPDRMNCELQYDPRKGIRTRSYSNEGGVANEQTFPPGECPLPQSVIESAHQAHVTLCNVAAAACRDAGWDPYALPNRNVGVYIGHTPPGASTGDVIYARMVEQTAQYLREIPELDQLAAGEIDRIIREIVQSVRSDYRLDDPRMKMRANAFHGPGLISRAFGLDGPSMAFDAACASSFRALGHGVRALQRGQVDMALVGGASYCHGDTLVVFSQAQSVSTNGSRPFDEDASGLVAGGGYVVLAMKTLERAIADGDRIQAVICGLGVSSDGKGKSLWAPRPEGQVEAIRRAYGHGMSLGEVQFLEMHATSTQVGDATELTALAQAAEGQFPAGAKVPIGSVKANIGHTLETAGIASLAKTVLALRNKTIPPQVNVHKLNSKIDWDNLPFFVPTDPIAWHRPAADAPRKTAVNAFGIGGLNVHVALQDYVGKTTAQAAVPQLPAANKDDEAIAIIGTGAVLPGARTIDALWDVLREGRDQKSEVPPNRWDKNLAYEPGANALWKIPTAVGGFVRNFEYDWKKHKVPPKQIAAADPLQFMLLDAADQAIRNAGLHDKPFDRKRAGVIVGTIFGGEFADQLSAGLRLTDFQKRLGEHLAQRGIPSDKIADVCAQYEDIFLKHMPALIDETGSFTASTLASRITKTFDLMGGAVAVDSGEASSISAIQCCVDVLLAGDCDVMICAAGQRAMGLSSYETFARNELLSRSEPHGPFDSRTSGFVPGEGVGVVVLKRLADAQRDGDTIHGIIRGIGVSRSDSFREGLHKAMKRSMQAAGIEPNQIAVLEACADGVPERDQSEVQALSDVFSESKRDQPLQVSDIAAQMGSLGGASGMAAVLKAVGELNHVETTGMVGLQSPLPELAAQAGTVQPVTAPTKIPGLNDDGRVFAGINSIALHKVAYHMVLEGPVKVPKETPAAKPAATLTPAVTAEQPSRWRITRIAAESLEGLQQRAAELAGNAAAAYQDQKSFAKTDRYRLAIVADSAESLGQKLTLAGKQAGNLKAHAALGEKGIFVGQLAKERPLVAFLFPGQGSQYDGMLKSLIDECPAAAEAQRKIDAVLRRLNLPQFADLAWEPNNGLGDDVWRTQLSLLIADTIVYAAASSRGLKADRVAGHSFGELVALVAAGAWTFEDAILATSARCTAIQNCKNANGLLVSTNATADVAEQILHEVGGRISISHFNAPEQTVLGGEEDAVNRMAEALKQRGFLAKVLDVPAAFHTPLMEEVKKPFGDALLTIPMLPPQIPLLSSVTNRYVSEPAEVRDNLALQMTQPVHYVELATRLADEGVSLMVEVGPRQVLTGLNKQILAGRDVSLVGCDHPKRNGMEQLLFAQACVEVTGALDPQPESSTLKITKHNLEIGESPAAAESQKPASVAPVASEQNADNTLQVAGTPYEIGKQLGTAQADAIRHVLRRYADLAGTKWDELADVTEAAAHPEKWFGPNELEELRGMASGAGVPVASLIVHNLRLYHETCAGGLHFAIPAKANSGNGLIHGFNEDLSRSLRLQDCLDRNIQVRRPNGAAAHVTFGVAGQIGTLCGINGHGVAVSTATLLDAEQTDEPTTGRLITTLVKAILEKATDINTAVAIVREMQTAGRWTLCITHQPTDRVCYIEFDGKGTRVQPDLPRVMVANHQLLTNYTRTSFGGNVPTHSASRLNRLKELLGQDEPFNVSAEKAKSTLRDRFDAKQGDVAASPNMHTVQRIDNQISIVLKPAERVIWVTGGPTADSVDRYTKLNLQDLLPEFTAEAVAETKTAAATTAAATSVNLPSAISARDLATAYAQAGQPVLGDGTTGVCSRFVMRVVEQPLDVPAGASLGLAGTAIILGDNAAAKALQQELSQRGANAVLVASTDTASAIAALEQAWQAGPIPHLFLMTARDDDAVTSLDPAAWKARRDRGVMMPYLVAQRWFQLVSEAKLLGQASLFAATAMGGDFGFSGQVCGAEGGAMTGLVKGVHLELEMMQNQNDFRAKIIDAPATADPQELARAICNELTAQHEEIEVGYVNGQRFVVRPVVESVAKRPRKDLEPGAPFIVTGGARGITAVVARELGKRFGAKLHLIGSSPAPEIPEAYRNLSEDETKELKAIVMKEALAEGKKPIDAWSSFEKSLEIDKTLRSFGEDGVQAVYHACDISNREQLAALLDGIRKADGPIRGIVHGAGFERATRFDKKKPELVDRTVAVKVDGAAALMDLTKNDPVEYFAVFGSVSGRFGGVGQTDYCVANDMLAKLIDWYRTQRPDCHATTFHWHAWDDVGMAVRPESKHIRELHDITFMPSREGVVHLLEELRAGLPEGEIAVTELKTCKERYAVPTMPADNTAIAIPKGKLPLIDAVLEETPNSRLVAELRLDPVNDIFLAQHRFRGRPLLPVVVAMEALVEAAQHIAPAGKHVFCLRDIEILNGLRFPTDDVQSARLRATANGDAVQCELTCDFRNRKGQLLQADKPYLKATADLAETPLSFNASPPAPEGDWHDVWYPEEDIVIYHGPVFRYIRQMTVDEREDGWARLAAPNPADVAGQRGGDGWMMPSAILDGCFYACGAFLWHLFEGVVAIPAGIDAVRLGRMPHVGETCTAHITFRGRQEKHGVFDFTLYGGDGSVILQVEGYRNVIVEKAPAHVG